MDGETKRASRGAEVSKGKDREKNGGMEDETWCMSDFVCMCACVCVWYGVVYDIIDEQYESRAKTSKTDQPSEPNKVFITSRHLISILFDCSTRICCRYMNDRTMYWRYDMV